MSLTSEHVGMQGQTRGMRSPVADAAAERRAAQVARAQGALMGVMVADAAGAHLEGKDAPPTASEIEHACGLPEGRFVAGGVTDDSELTLALALALLGDIKVLQPMPFNHDVISDSI